MEFRTHITFFVNHQLHNVDFSSGSAPSPFMTLLEFLREQVEYKSVKEGCGVGDCGACTVVVAIPAEDGALEYHSVNSCLILLPAVHAMHVITAEGLVHNGKLHPVQQALVDHHGSQCGYCTPGIVMSMFGLYKQNTVSMEDNRQGLAGNLCRCTGYQPILDASEEVLAEPLPDHFSAMEADIHARLMDLNRNHSCLKVQEGERMYLKPFSADDAMALRRQYPDASIIAGTTDTGVAMHDNPPGPSVVLDISQVPEFSMIRKTENGMEAGSLVSLERLLRTNEPMLEPFRSLLPWFGSKQIRNRATIGGNIMSASPIGDLLPLLSVMEAEVKLAGTNGKRTMPIDGFIAGYRSTALHPDEILESIIIPDPGDCIIRTYKVSRRKEVDITGVSASFLLRLSSGNIVKEIRIAYGGMSERVRRALKLEEYIRGKELTAMISEDAAGLLAEEYQPISDVRSRADTRELLAFNLLRKFFNEISQNAPSNLNS